MISWILGIEGRNEPVFPNVVEFRADEEHGVVGGEAEQDFVAVAVEGLVVGTVDLDSIISFCCCYGLEGGGKGIS